nr:MAG TPA: hypothetical protein [Caudoviricetes sp.]DAV07503.1 MAG TPA: hypothetical protein [Caudoviricetes sp.]
MVECIVFSTYNPVKYLSTIFVYVFDFWENTALKIY